MSTVQIGGNTYNCREYIKSAGGRWEPESKTWAIDDKKWAALVTSKPNLMRGCVIVGGVIGGDAAASLASVANAARNTGRPSQPRKMSQSGLCRLCHSYCYGDCQA